MIFLDKIMSIFIQLWEVCIPWWNLHYIFFIFFFIFFLLFLAFGPIEKFICNFCCIIYRTRLKSSLKHLIMSEVHISKFFFNTGWYAVLIPSLISILFCFSLRETIFKIWVVDCGVKIYFFCRSNTIEINV